MEQLSFRPPQSVIDSITSLNDETSSIDGSILSCATDVKHIVLRRNPEDFDTDINITKSKRAKKTLKGLINSRVKDDRRNFKKKNGSAKIEEHIDLSLTLEQVRDSIRKQLILYFSIIIKLNTPYTLYENNQLILKNYFNECIEADKQSFIENNYKLTKPISPFPTYLPKLLPNLNSDKWNKDLIEIMNHFNNDKMELIKWFYKVSINIEKSIYNHSVKQYNMKYNYYRIMNRNYHYYDVRRVYARAWNFVKTNLINVNGINVSKKLLINEIFDHQFVNCSHQELFPELFDETKYKSSIIMYYLNSHVVNSMIHCNKCKHNKLEYDRVVYYQLQTRSADEPMTTFCECLTCGAKFKF